MKTKLKKILVTVTIGLSAILSVKQNLNVSANQNNSLPTITYKNNQYGNETLFMSYGSGTNAEDGLVHYIEIADAQFSDGEKQINGYLSNRIAELKTNNEIDCPFKIKAINKENKAWFQRTAYFQEINLNEKPLKYVVVEFPDKILVDGTYDLEIYDGETLIGTWENVPIKTKK